MADHPADPVFDQSHMEIDEQPKAMTRQLQVSQKLGAMNRQHLLHRLDLHDDKVANNQIHAQPGIDAKIPIHHRQHDLPLDRDTARLQFVSKAILINRFEKSRPQRAMHRERGINNLTGNRIVTGRRLEHLGALAPWRLGGVLTWPDIPPKQRDPRRTSNQTGLKESKTKQIDC
jgi:hypothetical protein